MDHQEENNCPQTQLATDFWNYCSTKNIFLPKIQLQSVIYEAELVQLQISIFHPSRVCLRIKKLAPLVRVCVSYGPS